MACSVRVLTQRTHRCAQSSLHSSLHASHESGYMCTDMKSMSGPACYHVRSSQGSKAGNDRTGTGVRARARFVSMRDVTYVARADVTLVRTFAV